MPPPQSTSLARKVTTLSFRTAPGDTLRVLVCHFKISLCIQTLVHVPLPLNYPTSLLAHRLSTTNHMQSDPPNSRPPCRILSRRPLPGNTPRPPNHLLQPRLENSLKRIPANLDIDGADWGHLTRIRVLNRRQSCIHRQSCNPLSLHLPCREIPNLMNLPHGLRCAKLAFRLTHLILTGAFFAISP